MGLSDAGGDGQAHTVAAVAAIGAGAPEAIKHPRQLIGCKTRAIVTELEAGLSPQPPQPYPNLGARRAMPVGIVEQVAHQLAEQRGLADDGNIRLQIPLHALLAQGHRIAVQRQLLLDQIPEVEALQGLQRGLILPGQLQQILNKALHLLGGAGDCRKAPALRMIAAYTSTPRSSSRQSMNSSRVCACRIEPGPIKTLGTPAAAKMPAFEDHGAVVKRD